VTAARQTAVGLTLAALIAAAWLATHVWGVFFHPWTLLGVATAIPLIAVQTWLGAGMFIVAHDAMHGSLAPGRPRVNRAVGQLAVGLYAAFPFSLLNRKHHEHHRSPGSPEDPDFHAEAPTAFWPWYLRFFRTYFGWRQLLIILAVFAVYRFVLGASWLNAAVFWGLPSILSSLQLFTFGTWLPHRHEAEPFADRHNARSQEFGWLLSLLTCFHFGYHREHHLSPATPWWRLPAVRAERRRGMDAVTQAA
jgi:beta-carotene ketolase (CrtW type)